ncbi:MAG: redoxin domain-containing protein, partial [Bacteroidetes bacterium]|nr:redoxin domain-containing protein [Bacteroidota bacterium]
CQQNGKTEQAAMEDAEMVAKSNDEEKQFSLGESAPDFNLPDLNGEMISLSSLKGNIIVIHFGATWCPFCNAEAPHLEQLYQDYKAQGVEVFYIDVKEPAEIVQEKLQDRFNFSFPLLLDSDGSVAASYCPPDVQPDLARDEVMIASNLLIDTEGKIQFFSLLDTDSFDAKLRELKAKLDALLTSS